MNQDMSSGNESKLNTAMADVDGTLRMLANVAAPEGLEERVHITLRRASRSGGRVIEFPGRRASDSAWVRTAAAAAICFVVVGGGWGVYSRVQTARVIAMPSHIGAPGNGFSNSNAIRTPQTLNGPVINHPAATQPVNAGSRVVPVPAQQGQTAKTGKTTPDNQAK
jgi:hypothetical protein